MPPPDHPPAAKAAPASSADATGLTEVRYSLPALLAELKDERAAGSFAMEKLHQAEIAKLFQPRKKRRVKK
jgi:hypothetical protein